jgi:hypothetical protein
MAARIIWIVLVAFGEGFVRRLEFQLLAGMAAMVTVFGTVAV